jgi:hypothetical protein
VVMMKLEVWLGDWQAISRATGKEDEELSNRPILDEAGQS